MSVMALSEEIRPPLDFPCLHPNLNPPFSALFSADGKAEVITMLLVWQAASVFSAILVLGLIFRTRAALLFKVCTESHGVFPCFNLGEFLSLGNLQLFCCFFLLSVG